MEQFVDFIELIGPDYEEMGLIYKKMSGVDETNFTGLGNYLSAKIKDLAEWSRRTASYQIYNEQVEKARKSYMLLSSQVSSYLAGAENAVNANNWGEFQRIMVNFDKNYQQTSQELANLLKIDDNQEVGRLVGLIARADERFKSLSQGLKEKDKEEFVERKTDQYAGWTTLTDNKGGYQIKCPPEWYCQVYGSLGGSAAILSPVEPAGPLAEYLNLSIQVDVPNAEKNFLEKKGDEQTEVSAGMVGDYEAEKIVYFTEDNNLREYMFEADHRIFVVSVVSPKFRDQTQYLPFVEPILASFAAL